MNKKLLLLCVLLLAGCGGRQDSDPANISPTMIPTSVVTPVSRGIPADWAVFRDRTLGVQMAYPEDWFTHEAVGDMGEMSITSFDQEDLPNTGGVPESEVKVGVVRFEPSDSRYSSPMPTVVLDQRTVSVGEYSGLLRVLENAISVEVEVEGDTYLITAYPADTTYRETFIQMLGTFELFDTNSLVKLTSIDSGDSIESGVLLEGEAPGMWMFEGQLEVRVETAGGAVLGTETLSAEGDWMTEDLVPFSGEVEFDVPAGVGEGYVVFVKSNPSGLPENADEVRFRVLF